MAFSCPTCGSQTKKLIAPSDTKQDKLACPNCYQIASTGRMGLHDSFPGSTSKGLTNGKAWEIKNRIQSPDDPKVYINKRTGKETQY
jgi:hypothetical protein